MAPPTPIERSDMYENIEQAGEPDHHGDAAEEDRPPGVGHRRLDRRRDARPVGKLLAEAPDDEERVVDADREAEQRGDVHGEDREAEALREQVEHAQRDGHGQAAADDGQRGGDHAAEDEHEDDEGEGQGVGLRPAQVAGRDRLERLVDGRVAGDRGREAAGPQLRLDAADLLLRLLDLGGEDQGGKRCLVVARDQPGVAGRGVGLHLLQAGHGGRRDAGERSRLGGLEPRTSRVERGTREDDGDAGQAGVQAALHEIESPLGGGVGIGEAAALELVVEPGNGDQTEHEGDDPQRDDHPAKPVREPADRREQASTSVAVRTRPPSSARGYTSCRQAAASASRRVSRGSAWRSGTRCRREVS